MINANAGTAFAITKGSSWAPPRSSLPHLGRPTVQQTPRLDGARADPHRAGKDIDDLVLLMAMRLDLGVRLISQLDQLGAGAVARLADAVAAGEFALTQLAAFLFAQIARDVRGDYFFFPRA